MPPMDDLFPERVPLQNRDVLDPLALVEAEVRQTLKAGLPHDDLEPSAKFDEDAYLNAFPDVVVGIRRGDVASAAEHLKRYGNDENRLFSLRYLNALTAIDTDSFPPHGIDAVFATKSGRCLVIGWIDDGASPIKELSISVGKERMGATASFARCRRTDAEALVHPPAGVLLGFWTLLRTDQWRPVAEGVCVALAAGQFRRTVEVRAEVVDEQRIRTICLEYFATAHYFGNPQVDSAIQLADGLGHEIVDLNVRISRRITEGGLYCKRFGPKRSRFLASIVVCLYGKPEFVFLQASFFSAGGDWRDYEFIYVVNSPEITEALLKEAALSSRIYGVNITLLILPGNAGFGAANNIAVEYALSDRILICNPDVFPRGHDVGRKHRELIEQLPADQTRIFGAPLYYDDGSLMHAGMFFEIDEGVSLRQDNFIRRSLIRVEHYGKGAPPNTEAWLDARPVPAVTGAFISVDRPWYEKLGGFSLEYVFGHYEDADLCLKSRTAGQLVWMQPLPLWHLEGKGSNRRAEHEGGSLVNRWHFSELWGSVIENELQGRAPAALHAEEVGGE